MNIESIDLNLLNIFRILAQERNVTKAAKIVGLSQPAFSHALNRLRDLFNDPLFVRSSKGMAPTRRALELINPIENVLVQIENSVLKIEEFKPEKAQMTFNLATTDYFEQVCFSQLLQELMIKAPKIKLVSQLTSMELPKQALESGDIDLAIAGFYENIPEGFYRKILFKDEFVCVARKNHPKLKRGLTLKKYAELKHLLIAPGGSLSNKVDSILKKNKLSRDIVAGIFNFSTPGMVINETDLILTAPEKLAHRYQDHFNVDIFPLPFKMPPITIVQLWHERNHRDPAHVWLRQLIAAQINT